MSKLTALFFQEVREKKNLIRMSNPRMTERYKAPSSKPRFSRDSRANYQTKLRMFENWPKEE